MAHFAKIEDGIVTSVVVVDNEHETDGEAYLNSLGLEGQWVQTSYHANFRGKFAGIGDTYDTELDEFVAQVAIAIEPVPVPSIEPSSVSDTPA